MKLIFHSDTDIAAGAAAFAAALVSTTIFMAVTRVAAAKAGQLQQQQHLCLNEKLISIRLNLISIEFLSVNVFEISFVASCIDKINGGCLSLSQKVSIS